MTSATKHLKQGNEVKNGEGRGRKDGHFRWLRRTSLRTWHLAGERGSRGDRKEGRGGVGDRARSSPSTSVAGEAAGSFEAGSGLHSFCFRKITVATAEKLGSQGRKGGTVHGLLQ